MWEGVGADIGEVSEVGDRAGIQVSFQHRYRVWPGDPTHKISTVNMDCGG